MNGGKIEKLASDDLTSNNGNPLFEDTHAMNHRTTNTVYTERGSFSYTRIMSSALVLGATKIY